MEKNGNPCDAKAANVADRLFAPCWSSKELRGARQQKLCSSAGWTMWQMFGLTGTLWQADRPCDLESIYGTEVPAGVQRDDPWPVLYVAVLRSHCCTLDVDVHGAMAQGGPPWNGGGEKKETAMMVWPTQCSLLVYCSWPTQWVQFKIFGLKTRTMIGLGFWRQKTGAYRVTDNDSSRIRGHQKYFCFGQSWRVCVVQHRHQLFYQIHKHFFTTTVAAAANMLTLSQGQQCNGSAQTSTTKANQMGALCLEL